MRDHHRGVVYAVTRIGFDAWKWSIFPPDSVKGLTSKTGYVLGDKSVAVEAAKNEIETQAVELF